MIFSLDLKFHAEDHDAAAHVRRDLEALLEAIPWIELAIEGPFEVAPLVQVEDPDE